VFEDFLRVNGHGNKKAYWLCACGHEFHGPQWTPRWPKGKMTQWIEHVPGLVQTSIDGRAAVEFVSEEEAMQAPQAAPPHGR